MLNSSKISIGIYCIYLKRVEQKLKNNLVHFLEDLKAIQNPFKDKKEIL